MFEITSIEPQKKNPQRYSIFINNKYEFSLDDIDLYKTGLKVGQAVSETEIENFKEIYEFSNAKNSVLNYVSFKKRTRYEVKNKLYSLGYAEDVIERTLEFAENLGYINDENFAKAYINESLKLRPKGKRLLKQELINKGISIDNIENSITNSDIDEYEMADAIVKRKLFRLSITDEKQSNKLRAFLLRKGFNFDIVEKVLRENNVID